MEMSLLSWLALLIIYIMYALLGGCIFNDIEYDEKYRKQEAEDDREVKLIIVDLLEQVLLDGEHRSSNFTTVIRKLRQISHSNPSLNDDDATYKVKYCIYSLSWI